MKDRRFLLFPAAALWGLVTASVCPAHAASSPYFTGRTPRIAVIGGGLSGLTAVHELSKRGLSATVFEASDRLGGRILTLPASEAGLRVEVGAELVNSQDQELRGLLGELGLDLVGRNPGGDKQLFFYRGQGYEHAEFLARLFDNALPQLEIIEKDIARVEQAYSRYDQDSLRRFDRKSIARYLNEIKATPMLKSFIDAVISSQYGAQAEGLTSLALLESLSIDARARQLQLYPGKDEAFRVRGGTGKIISALAERHPDRARLSHSLTAISSSDGRTFRLSLDTPEGPRTVEADYVYMTLPLTSLRKVSVRIPGFTASIRRAVAQASYGANAKLVLFFTSRLWRELGFAGEGYSDQGYSFWDSSEGQPGPSGSLSVFLDGHKMTRQRAPEIIRRVLNQWEKVFPGIGRTYQGHQLILWPHSYPGADKPGQRTSLSIPEKPLGNFFWAGDFFSVRGSQSYMNGAVEAAQRAAGVLAVHILR